MLHVEILYIPSGDARRDFYNVHQAFVLSPEYFQFSLFGELCGETGSPLLL
jgi:hypothetical protein